MNEVPCFGRSVKICRREEDSDKQQQVLNSDTTFHSEPWPWWPFVQLHMCVYLSSHDKPWLIMDKHASHQAHHYTTIVSKPAHINASRLHRNDNVCPHTHTVGPVSLAFHPPSRRSLLLFYHYYLFRSKHNFKTATMLVDYVESGKTIPTVALYSVCALPHSIVHHAKYG